MNPKEWILLIIIAACLAYMDHLDDRRPFPNWGFVWHQTKRIMDACILLLFVEDLWQFLHGIILLFYIQILIYNHFLNPDSKGFFPEMWEGTKASFRWRG